MSPSYESDCVLLIEINHSMSNTNQDKWELISGKLHAELGEEEKEKFEAWSNTPENQKLLQKGQSIKDGLFESRKLQKADKKNSWNRVEKLVRKQKFTIYFRYFWWLPVIDKISVK